MSKERERTLIRLAGLLDGSRPRNRLGSLRWLTVTVSAAIRADDLLIPFGHLVQEGRKRLTTVFTQKIN